MARWLYSLYIAAMFFFDSFVAFAVVISFYRNVVPVEPTISPGYEYSYTFQFLSALIFARLSFVMMEYIFDRYVAPIVRYAFEKRKSGV